MKSALFVGSIAHKRYLPKTHSFKYQFFMWFLNLDKLDQLPDLGKWFSVKRWAFSRFLRSDYLGDPEISLSLAVKQRMHELTGIQVTGQVYGLMNMRTLGLYFSPVNFYYGYDEKGNYTHFLAEVSNIPWNERHLYCHCVVGEDYKPTNGKKFHVSPFNPTDQTYHWSIEPPGESIGVTLQVDDHRGQIFKAMLKLKRHEISLPSVRKQLLKKPIMTASVICGIYWQAFRLFIKGVPYIPYRKETT